MNNRVTEIEGIRGVLSVIVIAGHIYYQPLYWFWGCMEVFFCISGFLITRILLTNRDRAGFLKVYFTRRIIRIWPMYYVGMGFAYAIYRVTDGITDPLLGLSSVWNPNWYEVAAPFLFLQNLELYFKAPRLHYLMLFDPSWSVAVEEQFYLIWPFVILFVLRKATVPTRWLFAAGALMLSLLLRTALAQPSALQVWLLGCRLDGFILGAVLAYSEVAAVQSRPLVDRCVAIFRWLWIWPCLALTPYLLKGYFGIRLPIPHLIAKTFLDPYFNFALLGFSVLGYVVFHGAKNHASPFLRMLNLRPLQHLGTISYSTYLLHFPIVVGLSPYLISAYGLPPIFRAIIGFGLSIALAHLTYTYVEAQAMRLKRRFAYVATPNAGDALCTNQSSVAESSPAKP